MTLLSLGVIALLGLIASPAGVALRPGMNQALQALSAFRPIIDVSADSGCVPVTGACIPASASLGPSFSLAKRIAITGKVTATCGPFFSFGSGNVNLNIDQAAGREVAHAFASTTATCDGTSHTYTLTAIASNLTFHKGSAVATASVFAQGFDFNFNFVSESASTTQIVSLK